MINFLKGLRPVPQKTSVKETMKKRGETPLGVPDLKSQIAYRLKIGTDEWERKDKIEDRLERIEKTLGLLVEKGVISNLLNVEDLQRVGLMDSHENSIDSLEE